MSLSRQLQLQGLHPLSLPAQKTEKENEGKRGRVSWLAQAAITHYQTFDSGPYTTEIYLLTVLEANSLRSGCQHSWVLVRTLSGLQKATFPLCSHMVQRETTSSLKFSSKGIHFMTQPL